MYDILDWSKLRRFSHIIWDIDCTITDRDQLSNEVSIKIINLALSGVYHSFITGRNVDWIIKCVVKPMNQFFNFSRARDNLAFFAESGSVVVTHDELGNIVKTAHPAVADHPLPRNERGIRDVLRRLVYDPQQLEEHTIGTAVPANHELIWDADGNPYLVDRSKPSPPCHPYIWSTSKEALATLEKIRDEEGRIKAFDQEQYVEIITRTIEKVGLTAAVAVEVVSSAINIVPLIDGRSLGKSWAAGMALENLRDNTLQATLTLEEIMSRTVAIGDGLSDLDFTTPSFAPSVMKELHRNIIPIIFVGDESDLPVQGAARSELLKNIFIKSSGLGELRFQHAQDVISLLNPTKGPRVVSAILDFLKNWDYFGPFE